MKEKTDSMLQQLALSHGRSTPTMRNYFGLVGFKKQPHTDIGVHLGSVHGLNEIPKALLVAVHLPVSTNEKFPGHDCVVLLLRGFAGN